jgi:hypothetical protein
VGAGGCASRTTIGFGINFRLWNVSAIFCCAASTSGVTVRTP